jgi:hypothetical protein
MHTFGTNSEGDIHSVIDQKGHAILFGDLVKFAGCGNEISSIAGLVSVLHDGDT